MAWIQTIDEHHADDELGRLYEGMIDPHFRRVDNIMQVHSLHPDGLRAHHELYRVVMRGSSTLPKVDREMIALVVSVINECHY
jgi:alkylhydroperoxidase family enzyme